MYGGDAVASGKNVMASINIFIVWDCCCKEKKHQAWQLWRYEVGVQVR